MKSFKTSALNDQELIAEISQDAVANFVPSDENTTETSQEQLDAKLIGTMVISISELVEPEEKDRALRVRKITDSRMGGLAQRPSYGLKDRKQGRSGPNWKFPSF